MVITYGKWGTYPFHSVREWYGNLGVYLIARVVPFSILLYGLCRAFGLLALSRFRNSNALVRTTMFWLVIFLSSLSIEVFVSAAEWQLYPRYLTHQWYRGSFRLFELFWIKAWVFVFWPIAGFLFLVERFWRLVTDTGSSELELDHSRDDKVDC